MSMDIFGLEILKAQDRVKHNCIQSMVRGEIKNNQRRNVAVRYNIYKGIKYKAEKL
jgi:c-di-GMP-binding flagellar brake protein YcgR